MADIHAHVHRLLCGDANSLVGQVGLLDDLERLDASRIQLQLHRVAVRGLDVHCRA